MADLPETVGNSDDWLRVLDDLEYQLARLRDSAEGDDLLLELPTVPWLRPVGIGDLPTALAPRAAALVAATGTLCVLIERRRDETARQLRAVSSIPRDSAVTSIYLDSVG